MKNKKIRAVLVVLALLFGFCVERYENQIAPQIEELPANVQTVPFDVRYAEGSPLTGEINGNVPAFTEDELAAGPFEYYAPLDALGRCGAASAMLDRSLMPTEERGSIGQVKPSGWHTVRYDDLIPDKYLYNRCHLIAFCLAGENANEKNLITGTRSMNLEMLPYETQIADYIEDTGDRVAYRVTPVFLGDELVARGVEIEAQSVADQDAVKLHVFCYNVQPGIEIDYATGESRRS